MFFQVIAVYNSSPPDPVSASQFRCAKITPFSPAHNTSIPTTLSSARRFGKVLTADEIKQQCQAFVPPKTNQCNRWAASVYIQWAEERNSDPTAVERCPTDLLLSPYPTHVVDYWLAAFVLEARRKDGHYYPPNTIRNILAALYRTMKSHLSPGIPSFMDSRCREFYYPTLNNGLDQHLRMLRQKGIGLERKRATLITQEHKDELWRQGILGNHSPAALLNAVFFYNGKCFHLRGVQEHEQLKFGQIIRNTNPDRYTYYEHGSKNHSGGVNDDTDGKIVSIIASSHPHSLVALLDLYFSKVPQDAIRPDAPFYLKPLLFTPTGTRPWFLDYPLPKTRVQMMVKDMFRDAQIEGRFTNHSLRATGATALFDAGVSEAVIQKRTGHKSISALRQYERVTTTQNQLVANVLQPVLEPTGDPFDLSYSQEDLDLFAELVDDTPEQ